MLSSRVIVLYRHTILLLSLITVSYIYSTDAFSTGRLPPNYIKQSLDYGKNAPTALYANSITPPSEQHDKEKRNSEDDDDWTPIKGGFIPNFLRRQPKPKCNVHLVDTLQDYKKVVVDEANQLVVVRFFATWCRSCRASEPHFMKMVHKFSGDVKFVEVPLTRETAFMLEGLGVPTVPFAHIYHSEAGLVEEMRASKKFSSELNRRILSYVTGSCDLSSYEDSVDGIDSENSDAVSSYSNTPTGDFE